jgi:hypothetical protein
VFNVSRNLFYDAPRAGTKLTIASVCYRQFAQA